MRHNGKVLPAFFRRCMADTNVLAKSKSIEVVVSLYGFDSKEPDAAVIDSV